MPLHNERPHMPLHTERPREGVTGSTGGDVGARAEARGVADEVASAYIRSILVLCHVTKPLSAQSNAKKKKKKRVDIVKLDRKGVFWVCVFDFGLGGRMRGGIVKA